MTTHVENGDLWWGRVLARLAWAGAAFLLLVPAVAMQFTQEVNWGAEDFVAMGVLLFTCAGFVHLAARRSRTLAELIAVIIAVGASFLLVWINLAVGFIGDEGNPANLMFFGVILVALLGTVIARFRPRFMALAMAAAAAAQALVAVAALVAGWGATEPPGLSGLLAINGVFVGAWLASAALFQSSARRHV